MPTSEDQAERGDAPPPALPRSIWLLSESRRSVISTLAAIPFTGATIWLLARQDPDLAAVLNADASSRGLFAAVVAWAIFATLHIALTWLAYLGLTGVEFRRAVAADPAWQSRDRMGRSRIARLMFGFGPSSWAASMSMLALIAVITMVLRPTLRAISLALIIAVVMVGVSWLSVAVMYAVHYARVDQSESGPGSESGSALAFPGEQPDRLLDYMYYAVAVQATFGSTDVEVRTSAMRELVLGQSLMAFLYNTVILGMVISLLLGIT